MISNGTGEMKKRMDDKGYETLKRTKKKHLTGIKNILFLMVKI